MIVIKNIYTALRTKLIAVSGTSWVDMYNKQFESQEAKENNTYGFGFPAILIEIMPMVAKTNGGNYGDGIYGKQLFQGGIRIHIGQTSVADTYATSGSTHDERLSQFDYVQLVYDAVNGQQLLDSSGKKICNNLVLVSITQDNDFSNLNVTVLEFRTAFVSC